MKKTAYYFSCLLLVSYSLTLTLSLFIDGNLLLELVAMVLPYWLVLNVFLISIILTFWKSKVFYNPAFRISLIALLFSTTYLGFRFLTFTFFPTPLAIASTNQGIPPVKIAFLNKLYSNTNYSEIDKKLSAVNPDLLGLSEIKKIDISQIDSLKNYQCQLTKDSRDNAMLAFFSKYPCQLDESAPSLPHVLPIKLQINDKGFRVFVLHPYPPISTAWLNSRNSELNSLASYVNSLKKEVFILGDFNFSPWSNSYQKFASDLDSLKDTALGEGINYTWHGGMLRTQIDHIFVPTSVSIEQFSSERVEGSDHNLVWVKIN